MKTTCGKALSAVMILSGLTMSVLQSLSQLHATFFGV